LHAKASMEMAKNFGWWDIANRNEVGRNRNRQEKYGIALAALVCESFGDNQNRREFSVNARTNTNSKC
jgi:hypothetical protein